MPIQRRELIKWITGVCAMLLLLSLGAHFRKMEGVGHANYPAVAISNVKNATDDQLVDAISACKKAISNLKGLETNERGRLKKEVIPKEFWSLGVHPDFVRVDEFGCDLHLFKGIGKGIGFYVSSKDWSISWFNHFKSWESYEIVLGVSSDKRGI